MNKVLSIVIPSYNMEMYLPKCLGSLIIDDSALLQQLDIIVVNDGSQDKTSEIGHDFEHRYPGIVRVVDKQNGNYGSCINVGVDKATGVFIKVLDADDSFSSKGLVALVKCLASHMADCVDLVVSDFERIDSEGNVLSTVRYSIPSKETPFDDLQGDLHDLGYMHGLTYRTSVLREHHYQQLCNISYTDNEWSTIPMMYVREVAHIPNIVYEYLVGRQGQTVSVESYRQNWWMVLQVLKHIAQIFQDSESGLSAARIDYMKLRFVSIASVPYSSAIILYPGNFSDQKLKDFDLQLRQISSTLFCALEDRFYSRKFGFHYLREWRKRYVSSSLKLRCYRFFLRICRIVKR